MTTLAGPGDEQRWWAYVPAVIAVDSTGGLHVYGTWEYPMPMEGKVFDGEMFSPLPVPETHGGFLDLEGDAEHGWWAAGFRQPPDPGTVGATGAVWFSPDLWSWDEVEVPHPPDPETYWECYYGIWVTGKGDVLAVGSYQINSTYEIKPVLLLFDGAEWQEVDVPPHPESEDGQADLWDVWGADDEIFVVGARVNAEDEAPAILHYGPE